MLFKSNQVKSFDPRLPFRPFPTANLTDCGSSNCTHGSLASARRGARARHPAGSRSLRKLDQHQAHILLVLRDRIKSSGRAVVGFIIQNLNGNSPPSPQSSVGAKTEDTLSGV